MKDKATDTKNKIKDRFNQESNSQSKSSESRNSGGNLLEDDEYDAFFAPKFNKFVKWYLAEVNNQKSEKGFVDSLQGLDKNMNLTSSNI